VCGAGRGSEMVNNYVFDADTHTGPFDQAMEQPTAGVIHAHGEVVRRSAWWKRRHQEYARVGTTVILQLPAASTGAEAGMPGH
jgi:hypothetical protein